MKWRHVADGAFVGARDRSVEQVKKEGRLLEGTRAAARALKAEHGEDRASFALALARWAFGNRDLEWATEPAPRSFWRGSRAAVMAYLIVIVGLRRSHSLAGGCALKVAGTRRRMALCKSKLYRADRVLRVERNERMPARDHRPLSVCSGCACLRTVDILHRASGAVRALEEMAGKPELRTRSTNRDVVVIVHLRRRLDSGCATCLGDHLVRFDLHVQAGSSFRSHQCTLDTGDPWVEADPHWRFGNPRAAGHWRTAFQVQPFGFKAERLVLSSSIDDIYRAQQVHPSIEACEARLVGGTAHMISLTDMRSPHSWSVWWTVSFCAS